MYGLFKQSKEGNAPDNIPKSKSGMAAKYQYNAWCAVKGKSMPHAKIDYIITWSNIETKFSLQGAINHQLNGGDDAETKNLKAATKKRQQIDSVKNPMEKEVPRPMKVDNSEYLGGLTKQEKEIHGWFEEVRKSKKENKLLELVKSKKMSAKDTNKEGVTALMHAVDCDFSLKCIKELVNSGSEINHLSKDGMTVLCNAYALENKSVFAYLIEAGANADLKRPNGSSLRKEITNEENEDFMRLLPLTATQKKQLKKAKK